MAKTLGDVLRQARLRADLSQSALGRLSGFAPNVISRIEAGQRPNLQFATVARLAAILGLSLDAIAKECGLRERAGPLTGVRGPAESPKAIEALESARRDLLRLEKRLADRLSSLTRPNQRRTRPRR